MKGKEVFGIIIRLVGLVGLLYTCRHIYIMIHKTGSWHMGWLVQTWHKTGLVDSGELRALLYELLLVGFGIYLLRGAPVVIHFMYPEPKPPKPAASDPPVVPKE